jgi:hypothetical protein
VRGVFRTLCDLRIQRAIAVGLLTERREPTEDELDAGVEVGPDGMVERDLSYELKMPDPLRRNLPELMQLVADTRRRSTRRGSPSRSTARSSATRSSCSTCPRRAGARRAHLRRGTSRTSAAAARGPGGAPTSTGPDGQQHAALGELWRRITGALEHELDHDQDFRRLVETASASANGGSG